MKWENSMMAHEEDIEERSFLDWLKAHTSFMGPLHRYVGTLELTKDKLVFNGKDDKEGGDFNLEVDMEDIISSHYGFDEVFSWWEDRAFPGINLLELDISPIMKKKQFISLQISTTSTTG